MTSLILSTATRFLLPVLLLLSLFLLLRGHNEPGGGFVAGLVAAAAFALHVIARDVTVTRRILGVGPRTFIGAGLLLAAASGVWPLMSRQPFMTGLWVALPVPSLGTLDIGTPFVFDLGVYLVVLGVTLTIIFSLAEE